MADSNSCIRRLVGAQESLKRLRLSLKPFLLFRPFHSGREMLALDMKDGRQFLGKTNKPLMT